jgi:hypothetical protein
MDDGPPRRRTDGLHAGAAAAVLSGIPSTLHAWWTGGDVTEATRAAASMLLRAPATGTRMLAAAAVVHVTVSLAWAYVFARWLPSRATVAWAVAGACAVAVIDLVLLAPLFPAVDALEFWPQLADHVAWGLVVGLVVQWRRRATARAGQAATEGGR